MRSEASLAEITALYSAALPFILAWKEIDTALRVVSLDACENMTRPLHMLLAGQGISLAHLADSTDPIPYDSAVVTGIQYLNETAQDPDADNIGLRIQTLLHTLRPGGILILGGSGSIPGPHRALYPATSQTDRNALIKAAIDHGYAKAGIIPCPQSTKTDTINQHTGERPESYALIAQKPAFGVKFDVFSKAFFHLERVSQNRDLTQRHDLRTQKIEDLQAEVIKTHQDLIDLREAFNKTQRRRGLRKVIYDIKKSRDKKEKRRLERARRLSNLALPEPSLLLKTSYDVSASPLSTQEAQFSNLLFDDKSHD